MLGGLVGKVSDVLRPGISTHDLSVVTELVASVRQPDSTRTRELRQRYLAVILDGLRAEHADPLPATPPTWQEISDRWQPATERP